MIMRWNKFGPGVHFYFSPDDKSGGGKGDDKNVGGDSKNTEGQDDKKGKDDPDDKSKSGGDDNRDKKVGGGDDKKLELTETELQAERDRIATKVRDEEKRKYEKLVADAKDKADREEAEASGKWETLYKAEVQKNEALKGTADRVDLLSTRIHASIESEIEKWPSEVLKTDPGKDKPVEERLNWVDSHRDLAKRLMAGGAPDGEHGGGRGRDNGGDTRKSSDVVKKVTSVYERPKFE
jgi:hypothetical protein